MDGTKASVECTSRFPDVFLQLWSLPLAEKAARLHFPAPSFLMNMQITWVSSFLLDVVFLHKLGAGTV